MKAHTHRHSSGISSGIEVLEARITPSNILAVVAGHTLKITGTAGDDHFTLTSGVGSVHVAGNSGDTINGQAAFDAASGITGISVALSDGNDSVILSNGGSPLTLAGNALITGGGGGKTITSTSLTIGGNLTVAMGDSGSGSNSATFTNLQVNGSMAMSTKAGDTSLTMQRSTGGVSAINKNFTILNHAGNDTQSISDMNFGGAVSINNGGFNPINPHDSTLSIFNSNNVNFPSQFAKGISINYPEGVERVAISDAVIAGNVTINTGRNGGRVDIDGKAIDKPVVIEGNVTITGPSSQEVNLGTTLLRSGLDVGKSVTITGGGTGGNSTQMALCHVLGATKITSTGSHNIFFIDDSSFAGPVTWKAGQGGNHELEIDTIDNTDVPVIFQKGVLLDMGNSATSKPSTVSIAGSHDGFQVVEYDSTFSVLVAAASTVNITVSHLESPFGIAPNLPV